VLSDHRLQCWGDNLTGQLGDGTLTSSKVPRRVLHLTRVTQVTAGGSHTCALLAGGTIACWGYGFFGQLGDGKHANATAPVVVLGT
jgi:alpha-tubulin suppressor-like RCC1 family protein